MAKSSLLLLIFATMVRAGAVFDFGSDSGRSTPFTDIVAGLSATFGSPADPGAFTVFPGFFEGLTGMVLGDPGPADVDGVGLTINFNAPLDDISMNFATNSPQGIAFELDAFKGAARVGSVSVIGTIPADFDFPEGTISFGNTTFDSVSLSSSAIDFAIGDIEADAASAPEPETLRLCLYAAIPLLMLGWNRGSSESRRSPRCDAGRTPR